MTRFIIIDSSLRMLGNLEHSTAKWLLGEVEKGNEVVLEISPHYYSTWDYGKTMQ